MTRIQHIIPLAALLIAVLALPVLAGQGYEKFKGEVFAVQQQTTNQGADQMITVQTRNGEQQQFRLGDSGSCPGCVQVGDQVQARVSRGSDGQSGQVQSMKVKRNGEMFGYSNQSGQLVRTQQRLKDGSGSGQQNGGGGGNCNGSGGGGRGSWAWVCARQESGDFASRPPPGSPTAPRISACSSQFLTES